MSEKQATEQFELVRLGHPGGQRKFEWGDYARITYGQHAGKHGRVVAVSYSNKKTHTSFFMGDSGIRPGARADGRTLYTVGKYGDYYSYQLEESNKKASERSAYE